VKPQSLPHACVMSLDFLYQKKKKKTHILMHQVYTYAIARRNQPWAQQYQSNTSTRLVWKWSIYSSTQIVPMWKGIYQWWVLGLLYTMSPGWKNLGPSIFGLLFGLKLLLSAGTLAPRFANWLLKLDDILFQALETIQSHKVQHLLVTWDRLKIFWSISAVDS
jgi:hypothetical protein